ncbi:MAG: arylsulfatase [Planctomycetaceae bacterium]|nr:arylsulfatase [Planctomycetales bacterium]MCB9927162.1 arylsulfatase [Planctomycetaceae bacterium]
MTTSIHVVLLAVLCLNAASVASEQISKRAPNILLVMADDLGWSDIGCYGGEIATPHIDSLARDGLRFTQFYNNAVCGPTRASLLTGLYCQQVGHRGDRWNEPKDFSKCVTIAEVLQQADYRTAMVGKWQGRDLALDRGFDRFYGPMCQAKISYYDEVQGNPFYLDRERIELPDDFYLTDAFNEYGLRFLKESLAGEQPFFLYVAHIAPHWPLHAREADVAPYRKTYRELGWDEVRARRLDRQRQMGLVSARCELGPRPAIVKDWTIDKFKDWQAERMAVYAGQVAAIDQGLGQLLQAIDEAGAAENTLVMFLSDNGAAPDGGVVPSDNGFGFSPTANNANWRKDGVAIRPGSGPDHLPGGPETFAAYGLAWATASNTPLHGTKLEAFEGGIRTPLVVRWPAVIHDAGSLTTQPGHVIDFMATCLDVAGVSYPTDFHGRKPLPLEGKSLLPIFRGQTRDEHDQLCWSAPRHYAIRSGKWKAIQARGGGPWQLFDLAADPTELRDLSAREPDVLKELVAKFDAWQVRVGDEP